MGKVTRLKDGEGPAHILTKLHEKRDEIKGLWVIYQNEEDDLKFWMGSKKDFTASEMLWLLEVVYPQLKDYLFYDK